MKRFRLFPKGVGITGAVLLALITTGTASAGTGLASGAGDDPGCPAFQKTDPADGSVLSSAPALHWTAAFGALRYEVCVDESDDGSCDTEWASVGSSRQYEPEGLISGAVYYWQVRAITSWGTVYADFGDWWSFTIQSAAPGQFAKSAPADLAAGPADIILAWEASSGAEGYEYCYDTTDDGYCDGGWISAGSSTSAGVSGLSNTHTYYWQVRAVAGGGETSADGGDWWAYTVRYQSFADVPVTHWAWEYIERLYSAHITGGCGAGNYCPDNSVTRAQMAVFLLRGIHGASYTPPPATGTVFGDVTSSTWAAAWIEQLYAEGITGGCGGGNYCPSLEVSQAQMAVFLLRAEHGSSYTPPPATGTVFGDVTTSTWAAAWIEQLHAEGIADGCGGGNYCPGQPVTRAEMAVYLVRTFNLP